MKRHNLSNGWCLTAVGGLDAVPGALKEVLTGEGITATVPGCVHTDLMAAGLLVDPYVGLNEREQVWIDGVDWCYTLRFDGPGDARSAGCVELVCEGLDTIARVELNGVVVGESVNMFVPQRFSVKDELKETGNTLSITFGSATAYAQRECDRLGGLPFAGEASEAKTPYNMIRKMACNFGWDWGPALVTAGIWKPIYIETWGAARIGAVRPLIVRADAERAEVDLHVDTVAGVGDREAVRVEYELIGPSGDTVTSGSVTGKAGETARALIGVDAPSLWWPVGYGEQPLYTLRVVLLDADGHAIESIEKRIGMRSVALVARDASSPEGAAFHFEINGKRVYCKGANWIPDDCFPHRVTAERYRKRITQALEANMNMLRVWGGGLYESDDFYDVCDELGILVWQDLLTACALYPEEEPIYGEIEKEVRYHAARLSSHASLVLWNGGNECIWATFCWGDAWAKPRLEDTRGWGRGYWLEMFPKLIGEIDPSRPYWGNSPYSGSLDVEPNSEDAGNCHHWDVWNGHGDASNYLLHRPLFASEFGYHGPPTWPTLARSVPESERVWDSETMHHHNKQVGGQERADRLIRAYFNVPDNYDDWYYLAQLKQVRALTLGCSWFRSQSPWNSGALYWQLNDCWPVASWAAVDGDGRCKPLWYATKRFFSDRLVTIMPREKVAEGGEAGAVAVCLHNDCDAAWSGECVVRQMALDGAVVNEHREDVAIVARGSARFDVPDGMHDRDDTLLVAECGDLRAMWFFKRDKDIDYPAPEFDAELERDGDTYQLTITARTLLRDVMIYADRLDPEAVIDDQAVTLLPGEERTFVIASGAELLLEDLTARPVMQVANWYGKVVSNAR